ncbi:hypothetical protein GQX74_015797 [Glossina fuscipes]|nr:hypothetical protein GQX74_015797 [Glossina fuscipes]
MTYAQSLSAQFTSAFSIGIASYTGMPVSTTHVLSSAIAGAVLIDHGEIQKKTIKYLKLKKKDQAGLKILKTIYQAKTNNPNLEVAILVDWYRAHRTVLGKKKDITNSDWYSYMANKYKNIDVPIYGIPINLNEALGVLHLKGCIIDDYIFYSGASISNEYLNQFNTKYRYDRYQDISKILNLNKTVEIIVGDKISNDFYNPDNSIWVDRIWTLLTGNNFNARAWCLDLENAILIHDPKQEIKNQRKQELSYIYKYTKRINSFQEIEKISDYPKKIN